MLRATTLIFRNEFRLLAKDRVGLFMLVLAPIVIISVAGFSLGTIYGARPNRRVYVIPLVNQDGAGASAIVQALEREPSIRVLAEPGLIRARSIVSREDRAPLAIVIPRGTTESLANGRDVRLIVYADPIKRIEANAIEVRLGELCAGVSSRLRERARTELNARAGKLNSELARLNRRLIGFRSETQAYRRRLMRLRADSQAEIEARMRRAIDQARDRLRAQMEESAAAVKASISQQLAPRQRALADVSHYLDQLQAAEGRFDQWFAALKRAAGSHASRIPPPPAWPPPPDAREVAELSKPLDIEAPAAPDISAPRVAIRLPSMPPFPRIGDPLAGLDTIAAEPSALPGTLGWAEHPALRGGERVNAFDQYVPGFGITFLLIGMLMGISLGLIDERDWGTLQRLRVSGVPLTAIVMGKLLSRLLIGFAQLVILFAIGWLLFGISLGRYPAMLLAPAIAISFAAASFGLVVACVARTHDSVMPVGAVVAMAMSAIGGCWWPVDFEPSWMRAVAQWLPTTWTMRAFNDLMIRGSAPASVIWPSTAVFGLGAIYLCAGLIGTNLLYRK